MQQASYTRGVDTYFLSDRPITLSGALLERLKVVGFFNAKDGEQHEYDAAAAHEEYQDDIGAAIVLSSDEVVTREPEACRRPAAMLFCNCWSYVPRLRWDSTEWPCRSRWNRAGPCRAPAARLLHT